MFHKGSCYSLCKVEVKIRDTMHKGGDGNRAKGKTTEQFFAKS